MLTPKRAKKIKSQKGATVVEFALLAAVFFVILLGFLEFGFLFFQTHFVANAAREGVRIGILANNYECFENPIPGGDPCPEQVQRKAQVEQSVREYLLTLYAADMIEDIAVTATLPDPTDPPAPPPRLKKTLTVTVEVENFMPVLLTGLVDLLDLEGETTYPFAERIFFTAEGEYEDPIDDPDI